jgi:GNAT superfamily N-acetyltransferase
MVELLVTYMAMTAPPAGTPLPVPVAHASIRREALAADDYRALYRAIGDAVQWDQRLRMPASELEALLNDPATHLHVLRLHGEAIGLCEFERVGAPAVELVNFGLVPAAQGRRLGPWLLDHALRAVWAIGPERIWLHTDTNDHPKAVATYERAGFRPYRQSLETFPD